MSRSKKVSRSFQLPITLSRHVLISCLVLLIALAIDIAGGLPFLLVAAAVVVTGISLYTRQGTDQVLDRIAVLVGGSRNFFLLIGIVVGISLIAHGAPGHTQLFEGAKKAADDGIGDYIGDDAGNMILIITFAMWALIAVGGIAVIAGGISQNVMVLSGGLVLFFGVAILMAVLQFSDGLLFGAPAADS